LDARWLVPQTDIETLEEIAHGALGKVFKAVWQRGTEIAVKKLFFLDHSTQHALGLDWTHEQLVAATNKFLHECQINSQVRHPNIVQFLGVGIDADREPILLMMEYMAGGSLRKLLKSQAAPLPLSRQLAIMINVCAALVYLHTRSPPILHLDVKSDNVLLDSEGRAKLGDLGESHAIRSISATISASQHTLTPYGIGTPLYMAPELRSPDASKSGRTDVFSFGVLMAEIATGRPPCPTNEQIRTSDFTIQIVPEERRRQHDIAAITHERMRALVERIIVHVMPDRYDAQQTLQALLDIRDGQQ
jgi:serine/threonine protein kinase